MIPYYDQELFNNREYFQPFGNSYILSRDLLFLLTFEKMCPICWRVKDNVQFSVFGESKAIFNSTIIQQTIHKILEWFPPNSNLKPLILFGTIWSDGFHDNNSLHNAPSTLIYTIIIASPQDVNSSQICFAYRSRRYQLP